MDNRATGQGKPGFVLAVIATLLAVLVVGLGAWTRLVHAGLGCPDWPGCYGFLTVPASAQELALAAARFPDAPVESAKGWPEMIHRYLAGTLLVLVAGLAASAIRHRHGQHQSWKLPLVIFALLLLQAGFGMWTVTLKLWPQVVTAHLLGGFATLTLLILLTVRLSHYGRPIGAQLDPGFRPRKLARIALVVVVVQIALGGWTSANYAALACPDLPTCQGQLWPTMDFTQGFALSQAIGPNYLGGQLDSSARTAIHMAHRLGAVITTILVGFLAISGLIKGANKGKLVYGSLLFALGLQVVLGLSNVAFYLPLAVAVAHNLGGALLLALLAVLNDRLRMCTYSEQPS